MINVKSVITSLSVALVLATFMFFAFQTIETQAGGSCKVEICHTTSTFIGALGNEFAEGHVISISTNACKAHCTNHNDTPLSDGDCVRTPFDDLCIVSLGNNLCTPLSVEECIAECEEACD